MKLKFHPGARLDLREGRQFYRDRSPLAAIAFTREIERALAEIEAAPLRHPEGEHGTRTFVLPRSFPYTVVYRLRSDAIVIVAIAHQSREPRYWLERR